MVSSLVLLMSRHTGLQRINPTTFPVTTTGISPQLLDGLQWNLVAEIHGDQRMNLTDDPNEAVVLSAGHDIHLSWEIYHYL